MNYASLLTVSSTHHHTTTATPTLASIRCINILSSYVFRFVTVRKIQIVKEKEAVSPEFAEISCGCLDQVSV